MLLPCRSICTSAGPMFATSTSRAVDLIWMLRSFFLLLSFSDIHLLSIHSSIKSHDTVCILFAHFPFFLLSFFLFSSPPRPSRQHHGTRRNRDRKISNPPYSIVAKANDADRLLSLAPNPVVTSDGEPQGDHGGEHVDPVERRGQNCQNCHLATRPLPHPTAAGDARCTPNIKSLDRGFTRPSRRLLTFPTFHLSSGGRFGDLITSMSRRRGRLGFWCVFLREREMLPAGESGELVMPEKKKKEAEGNES